MAIKPVVPEVSKFDISQPDSEGRGTYQITNRIVEANTANSGGSVRMQADQPAPDKKAPNWLWFAIIVAAIIGLGIMVAILWSRGNDEVAARQNFQEKTVAWEEQATNDLKEYKGFRIATENWQKQTKDAFDNNKLRLETAERRLDGLDKTVTAFDGRLQKDESNIAIALANAKAALKGNAAIDGRFDAVNKAIGEVDKKMDNLGSITTGLKEGDNGQQFVAGGTGSAVTVGNPNPDGTVTIYLGYKPVVPAPNMQPTAPTSPQPPTTATPPTSSAAPQAAH